MQKKKNINKHPPKTREREQVSESKRERVTDRQTQSHTERKTVTNTDRKKYRESVRVRVCCAINEYRNE